MTAHRWPHLCVCVQEGVRDIAGSLGRHALQGLWVALMSGSHASDAKSLQWLALLACW